MSCWQHSQCMELCAAGDKAIQDAGYGQILAGALTTCIAMAVVIEFLHYPFVIAGTMAGQAMQAVVLGVVLYDMIRRQGGADPPPHDCRVGYRPYDRAGATGGSGMKSSEPSPSLPSALQICR